MLKSLCAALLLLAASSLRAGTLMLDAFETYNPASMLPTTGLWGADLGVVSRDQNTSILFGTTNKFIQLTGGGRLLATNTNAGLGLTGNVRTVSFDIAQIDTLATATGLTVGFDNNANGADVSFLASFAFDTVNASTAKLTVGGVATNFAKSVVFSVSILFNASGSTATYLDPNTRAGRTLAAYSMDVWLTNATTASFVATQSVSAVPYGRFGFRQYSGASSGNYLVDNFRVYDTPQVYTRGFTRANADNRNGSRSAR